MKRQNIKIEKIELEWSDWVGWNAIKIDGRTKNAIKIPNRKPGVYEVRSRYGKKRLTIGRTSNLRFRVRQALVKGKSKHSSGNKIRKNEKAKNLIVRWAETVRPSATEEELHRLHRLNYGCLPEYTERT